MRLTDLRCPRDGSVPIFAIRDPGLHRRGVRRVQLECLICGHDRVIERRVAICKFCGRTYTHVWVVDPGTPDYLVAAARDYDMGGCSTECDAALESKLDQQVGA